MMPPTHGAFSDVVADRLPVVSLERTFDDLGERLRILARGELLAAVLGGFGVEVGAVEGRDELSLGEGFAYTVEVIFA
jgi:hypothetical protein